MPKIGIDARLYSQTGVGVYLRNLLHYLEQKQTNITFFIYLLPEDYKQVNFTNKSFVKRLTTSRWHTFSEQIIFNSQLTQDNLDLMHFTYFSYPVLYKKKFIVTIHDTTPLIFKTGKASTKNPLLYEIKFQAFKFVMAQQVEKARFIITPTKTVKKQLTSIYGEKHADKISAIYEGVDNELIKIQSSQGKKEIQKFKKKDFFIYIGNFYPHKNVENLVRAYVRVKTESKLILIGPDDFFAKRLLHVINQFKQDDRIIFYHNPTKKDLVFFYQNARALVHPSLSEGFGLPIVESMFFKLPILASNIEVFQELLADKYISFDPNDSQDIADKITEFLNKGNKITYGNLLNKFSFSQMAEESLALYERVLG